MAQSTFLLFGTPVHYATTLATINGLYTPKPLLPAIPSEAHAYALQEYARTSNTDKTAANGLNLQRGTREFLDDIVVGLAIDDITNHQGNVDFYAGIVLPELYLRAKDALSHAINRLQAPSTVQQPIVLPMDRFKGFLRECHITRPDVKVLQRIANHFSTRLNVVFDADTAVQLYDDVKNLPGTSTNAQIAEEANIKLDGLYNPSYSTKIITGADADGRPILVKVLVGTEQLTKFEVDAVNKLKLDNPSFALVPTKVHVVTIQGEDISTLQLRGGQYSCLIMPHFPTTLAQMDKLLSMQALYNGGLQIRDALRFVHEQGLVHMDVKPANIFVSTEGHWYLGDFGSCVKVGSPVYSCSEVYLSEKVMQSPARVGFDSYMLATSLMALATSLQDIRHNSEMRIDHNKLLDRVAMIDHEQFKRLVQDLLSEYQL